MELVPLGRWVARTSAAHARLVRQMTRLRKDHAYAFAPSDWDRRAVRVEERAERRHGPADWAGKKLMIHYWIGGRPELIVL